MRIKDLPKVDRPREKLISKGPQNLKDQELLAILLRTGREGKNVLEVAKQVLSRYSKKRLLKLAYEDLINYRTAERCGITKEGRYYSQKPAVSDTFPPR